jgi:hypothetical protein
MFLRAAFPVVDLVVASSIPGTYNIPLKIADD